MLKQTLHSKCLTFWMFLYLKIEIDVLSAVQSSQILSSVVVEWTSVQPLNKFVSWRKMFFASHPTTLQRNKHLLQEQSTKLIIISTKHKSHLFNILTVSPITIIRLNRKQMESFAQVSCILYLSPKKKNKRVSFSTMQARNFNLNVSHSKLQSFSKRMWCCALNTTR